MLLYSRLLVVMNVIVVVSRSHSKGKVRGGDRKGGDMKHWGLDNKTPISAVLGKAERPDQAHVIRGVCVRVRAQLSENEAATSYGGSTALK
jgi:hypothetical protein